MTGNLNPLRNKAKSAAIAAAICLAAGLFSGCAVERQRMVEERRTMAFDLYNQGEQYERAGDYNKALQQYLAALELNERPAFLYKTGRMHHLMGNPERAAIFYDRALELQPDFDLASTHRELARLEMVEEGVGKSNATARAEATPPPIVPAPRSEIQTAEAPSPTPAPRPEPPAELKSGTESRTPVAPETKSAPAPEAAVAQSTPVPEPKPAAPPAPVRTNRPAELSSVPQLAGTAFERLNEAELREVLFPELIQDRADPALTRRLAVEAAESGRWPEAVLAWSRVIANDPKDIEARLTLARAYRETNRIRRAMDEYQAAAELAPNDPEVQFQWGNALADSDPAGAEARYLRALELRPDFVRARNNLGAVYIQIGRFDWAAREFRVLLGDAPDFGPAHLNLARALDSSGGDLAEAIEHVESYLRLEGEGQEQVEEYLVHLRARLSGAS